MGQTSENYRISQLADIVAEVVPGCSIEYAPGGGPDKRCYRVSCDKIQRALPNFHPKWTARSGAQELYEAYRREGLSATQLQSAPLHANQPNTKAPHSEKFGRLAAVDQTVRRDRRGA